MHSIINQKAFTILELLIVVAVVAIIAIIAIPSFIFKIEQSKYSAELAEINSARKAANMYYIKNGYYPTMQGDQPSIGDPKNIRFSDDGDGNEGLYPNYLSSLPHFSYWYIDYSGNVYHTEYSVEEALASGDYTIEVIGGEECKILTFKR